MFDKSISIEGREIGAGHPCYIIAEGGVNHFGDIGKALSLVDVAADAGADAFKTQHFKTEALIASDAPGWRERLKPKELSDDEILRIRDRCNNRNITFLCTAHDEISLEFLVSEGISAFKIGSGEVDNWPFITKIASYKKPVILSEGMYTEQQILKVIQLFERIEHKSLAILHCHTSYPSNLENINLQFMNKIREIFSGPVGYSDHTVGISIPLAAVAMGANIIEKHITLDKNVPNAHDWIVSSDPEELVRLIVEIKKVETARGRPVKILSEQEQKSILWARKSLSTTVFIPKGSSIMEDMLTAKRPGDGISPSLKHKIVGRIAKHDINKDCLVKDSDLL